MEKRQIRVLHVIGSLGLGGSQICLKYMVEQTDENVKSFVYPLRPAKDQIEIECDIVGPRYPNYDLRKILAIIKLCKQYKIDIIHAHLDKAIIASLLASFFCKAKVVIHEHGPIFKWTSALPGYRTFLRLFHNRAEKFIAVSKMTAGYLKRYAGIPDEQIKIIYNAVEFKRFDVEVLSNKKIRESLGIPEDKIVLGFSGRLAPQKGVDILLRALEILTHKSDRYILLLAGQGQDRSELEQLAENLGIKSQTRFLGYCSNIEEIMSTFDIGMIPSRYEPFGIVALEMMRMKVPILTSGVDGLAEFLQDNETALITKSNTPEQIAAGIDRLAGNPNLCQKLTENAFKQSEKFSVENFVDSVGQIYDEITKN